VRRKSCSETSFCSFIGHVVYDWVPSLTFGRMFSAGMRVVSFNKVLVRLRRCEDATERGNEHDHRNVEVAIDEHYRCSHTRHHPLSSGLPMRSGARAATIREDQ